VQHAWTYIWNKSRSFSTARFGFPTQPRLKPLDVYHECTRPYYSDESRGPNLALLDFNEIFKARLSERDDEARTGSVEVTNAMVEAVYTQLRQEEGWVSLDKELEKARRRANCGAYEYLSNNSIADL